MLRSIDPRVPLANRRPVRTRDFSVEVQRSGPAVLPRVYKSHHLVTIYLGEATVARGASGGWARTSFRSGDSAIRAAGPGEPVRWLTGVECVHVHLHPRLIRRVGEAMGGDSPVALHPRRRLSEPTIREIGFELYSRVASRPVDEGAVRELVTALAHFVTRAYPAEAPPPVRVGLLTLEEVLDSLRDGVCGWSGVAGLAKQAGLTRSHFSRVVRARSGSPPYALARLSRLEAAKHLLGQPTLSLSAVAHLSGFADQSHLTRSLRRATGLTPGRFRARPVG